MKINIEYAEEELKKEIWQPIPHYEQEYEASSLGRIRTKEGKTTFTTHHGVRRWQQRILKPKYEKRPRNQAKKISGRVELWKNGQHKTLLVARLVLSSFDKTYDLFSKMTVNHIDDNPLNNRIENLEWCSRKENIQKGFLTGAYKNCYHSIQLLNKNTGEKKIFANMTLASKFIGQNKGYLSNKIKRKQFENLNYKWKIIKN